MGTYAGALEARQIKASGDSYFAEATGEVEKEEGVLYPMIERVLARSSADLVGAMQAFGAYDVCAA